LPQNKCVILSLVTRFLCHLVTLLNSHKTSNYFKINHDNIFVKNGMIFAKIFVHRGNQVVPSTCK